MKQQLYLGIMLLMKPISLGELKEAVFGLPGNSAPGPDGYNAKFFQNHWTLIHHDLLQMVQSFWHSEHLLKELNKTNIVLIPKIDNPQVIKDFRPISLCNVAYKIVSKLLSNRLKPILASIIAPNQSAFLKGRLISDNIMLASELMDHIHSSREGRRKLAALKIDFSKAFDRISWNFISAVLFCMGFSMKWVNLIGQCISTVEYNLLFNGQIASVFKPTRGVRQGDPLSPYLYIISANVLSCLICHQESQNLWNGIKLCRSASAISHLLYADDSLLFTEASTAGFSVVSQVLQKYSDLSGQIINFQKSSIIFSPNVPHNDKLRLSRTIDIPFTGRLGKYLGTWVDPGRNKSLIYQHVLNAIDSRTASWKSKLLSQASSLHC